CPSYRRVPEATQASAIRLWAVTPHKRQGIAQGTDKSERIAASRNWPKQAGRTNAFASRLSAAHSVRWTKRCQPRSTEHRQCAVVITSRWGITPESNAAPLLN